MKVTQEDLKKQFDLMQAILGKVTQVHDAVKQIRDVRAQINAQNVSPQLPDGLIPHVVEGVPTLISPGDTQLVGAIQKLRG